MTIHSILDLGVKPHLISKALLLSNFLYKHRGLENVHHCSTPAAKDCIIRSSCVPYDKVHQKSMLCFILPQTLYLFVLSSIFLLGYSDVVKYHRCRDSSSRTLGSRCISQSFVGSKLLLHCWRVPQTRWRIKYARSTSS